MISEASLLSLASAYLVVFLLTMVAPRLIRLIYRLVVKLLLPLAIISAFIVSWIYLKQNVFGKQFITK